MDFAEMKAMVEAALAQSQEEEGYTLGVQAFKYGYPMIEMYRSRWEWHFDKSSPNYNGPLNSFGHTSRATHEDTFVVTPINDAVYSRAFVDLSNEPYVIVAPKIADRYWTVQHCDFYTNSFGYVGTSKGDTEGGAFVLVGPDWRGVLPEGLTRILECPTPVACLLARVTVLNDEEAPAVALQKQFKLTPLSVYTGEAGEAKAVSAPKPYRDFKGGNPLDFFTMMNWCLTENPPPLEDAGMMGLFERISVGPGMEFEPEKLHPAMVTGLQRAIKQGLTSMIAEMPFCVPNVNGWLIPHTGRSGNFGTDFYLRLETAEIGLLANDAREALYIGCFMDEHGEPLVGGREYVIHFDKNGLPPVRQFWSLTMYTHPPGFLTESSINRYAIGSLTPGLKYNEDGSLDIYIRRDSPGANKESNWLPTTPPGELFRIIQRLYNPKGQILNGLWKPPAIQRVE